MNLKDAILNIRYDSNWGVWAEFPFTPESKARYGRFQFVNGGINDDMRCFHDGESIGNYISNYVGDESEYPGNEDLMWAYEEAAEDLIQIVSEYFEEGSIN